MKQLRFFALLWLAPLLAARQERDPVVETVVREGRENPKVMEHLDHLVNKIGPRLTGSDSLTKACEWTRDQFKSFGIENARLEEWGTFPVAFNRGPWSGEMTAPEKKKLTCGTMAWTPGTDGPVEGPAMLAPAGSEDLKAEYKGAWIVSPPRLSDAVTKALDEAGVAGYVRGSRNELLVTDGNHRIRWENLPKRVNVQVVSSEFKDLVARLEKGESVRLRFDIKNEFKQGPVKLFNVIADIPGTEKPEEMVIVGGHIDSWDGATGTNDNGTGVSTTLEAARLLMKAGAKPKRTIRFMLWSGEEQGLLGSAGWIQKHRDDLKNISCVLVHDGGTNYVSGIVATNKMVPMFEKAFAPARELDGAMKFKIREVQRLPYGIGSDHDSFLGAGVPGFFWAQSGRSNYVHVHHTQHDTYDSAIPEYQKHSAVVIALGAWGLANAEGLVPRDGLPTGGGGGHGRMLGVNLDEDGVTVTGLMEGYPAEKAGIKVGDKIVKVGDRTVASREDLINAIRKAPKKTKVVVLRGGKEISVAVEFTE